MAKNLYRALPEFQTNNSSYQKSTLISSKLSNSNNEFLTLLKLHGSADEPESIIPPTWNKILSHEKIELWKKAYESLSNSDEIRVIGYSLPISDVYFRYFLMSCIRVSNRLEKFQVISLDSDGNTKKNYENFFAQDAKGKFHFYGLEDGHKKFVSEQTTLPE